MPETCKKPHPSFRAKKTCDECPWRKDVPVGRFPPERFRALRCTVEEGFNPFFACHKTSEEGPAVCVGYLLRDGERNFNVRVAAMKGRFDFRKLEAAGPLYKNFEEMARANGAGRKKRSRARKKGLEMLVGDVLDEMQETRPSLRKEKHP